MEEIKKNRLFIGAGLLIIALGLYINRKKIDNKNKVDKSNINKNDLPKRFIEDVKNMTLDEINETIEANKNLLSNKGIPKTEKEAIKSMLTYLEEQSKNKK